MAKSGWKSQKVLAMELGLQSVQVVHNWIQRKDKRIMVKTDPNTGMRLVKYVGIKK